MKIVVVKIGKPATKEIPALVSEYIKRCRAFGSIESLELKELKDLKELRSLKSLSRGGTSHKQHPLAGPGDLLVALDERGAQWSSKKLATNLQKWTDDPGTKTVFFLIGGPYGLDDETRAAATHLWSLSELTLQGDLAWLVTWEQIYRAFTIIKGMPYHHD